MFRLRSPRRVANKIIVLVVLLELVSISLWGSLTYLGSRDELLRTISSQLSEAAYRTTSDVGNFFLPIYIESRVLAAAAGSRLVTERQKEVLLHRLMAARPELEEASLVSAGGREQVRVSRMRGFGPRDLRFLGGDPLVESAIHGKRAIGEITFSRYFDPQIRIATPVNVETGHADVILATVNLKWLWDTVQALRVGKTGYAYVVDEHLKLVAYPDPSLVLAGRNLASTGVPGALFHGTGQHELLIYRSLAGVKVAGVSRFDPLHHWWVVVEQPVKEGLAPLDRVIHRFIVAFLLAAMVTTVIVVVFSRITMQPLETLEKSIERLARGERNVRVEVPGRTELGALARAFNTMARNLDEQIEGLVRSEREVRESKEALKASEEQVRLLLDSTAEAIFGVDLAGKCTFCNPATLRYLGYSDMREVLGQDMYYLLRPSLPDGRPVEKDGCPFHQPDRMECGVHMDDMVLWRSDGSRFHAECWSHPIRHNGRTVGAVATFVDITERYLHTAMLEYQASHDSLTDLPNRQLLHVRLEQALRDSKGELALLLIDLDRFKEVNDSLGHKSGDQLLKKLGPRLHTLLGNDDTLARLGGDEFAVLLCPVKSTEDAIKRATLVRAAIREPFDIHGMRIQIDASIGIALSPLHGRDASTLLRLADVAMYQAKAAATGYAVYDRRFDEHSPRRLGLMSDLGRAVDNDELVLYYQPKIDLTSGNVTALEALVRWQHPEHGLLGPEQFVPLAELGEMIKPLTFWVIDRALRDMRSWRAEGEEFAVAVNISARNLQDQEFVAKLTALLEFHGGNPGKLQLEITESAIMTDPVRAKETILALDALGVSLAIDDFGTGYSSLSYLKQLPVDELKIDKSFVIDMQQDENDAVIVRSTVDLAHNLGLRVTAEGVESADLWDLLVILDCDYAQGFHICPPVSAPALADWLVKWRASSQELRRATTN